MRQEDTEGGGGGARGELTCVGFGAQMGVGGGAAFLGAARTLAELVMVLAVGSGKHALFLGGVGLEHLDRPLAALVRIHALLHAAGAYRVA